MNLTGYFEIEYELHEKLKYLEYEQKSNYRDL